MNHSFVFRGAEEKWSVRCLIVEDDPVARTLALLTLGDLGLVVDAADSGEQARELASTHCYQMVILDHHLGSMVGHQALEALSANLAGAELIVMTGNPSAKLKERYTRLGALHVLQKPFEGTELAAIVIELMKRRDRRRAQSDRSRALKALFAKEP